jgi:SNF2 family DNA or RNA helicase
MGLGKTIPDAGRVEILVRAVGIGRVLIVCPTSLKHQWRQEIEKFTDRIATVIDGGIPAAHSPGLPTIRSSKITNYELLRQDSAAESSEWPRI